jgi:class 3 adenylate cyclase
LAEPVTLLLTDVEGSTQLWESAPDAMSAALARHDALVNEAVSSSGGRVIKARGQGDSMFAVFREPAPALRAIGHGGQVLVSGTARELVSDAALANLAAIVGMQGEHAAARARHEQALALARQLGDKRSTAGIATVTAELAKLDEPQAHP